MPGLRHHLNLSDNDIACNPEDVILHLPSQLPPDARAKVCDQRLSSAKDQLREAEACEALEDLRRHLRSWMFANKFKIKNITGQKANTRARMWQKTIDNRAVACKHRYRRARTSLLALRGPGDWETILRVLNDADVRALNERALTAQEEADWAKARQAAGAVEEELQGVVLDGDQLGEGWRTLSWIWFNVQAREFEDDVNMHEGMSNTQSVYW